MFSQLRTEPFEQSKKVALTLCEPKSSLVTKSAEDDKLVESKDASDTIYIIATGGTIAGTSTSSVSSVYESGKLKIASLMTAVPELKKFEKLESIDLFHIDSSDITTQHWLTLAKKVNQLLQEPHVKGVVITHGTDTLEETAYFLDLVIKSKKPVVLVGSMRAASSLSPDGPLNLFNAVEVANSPKSIGKGVLVVMNDTIYDARDVTKTNTSMVNTFFAPNGGAIGHVNYGEVEFVRSVMRKHTIDTPFDVSTLTELPEVEIIYECAGSSGKLLRAAIDLAPAGIVIAGTGNGNITARDKALMVLAREKGIEIIRSSRTGSGKVTYDNVDQLDSKIGLIPGDNLNPQKARILLMLSLTLPRKELELRNSFLKY
ncbi:MAG: asparaginase [Gammaproteobacteria bacterium]